MGKIVIDELQAYLVAEGIGQDPAADPSLTVPSIWTRPRRGAAMPRTANGVWLETQTVTLDDKEVGSAATRLPSYLEDAFVDITVRSKNPDEGKLVMRAIKDLIVPIGSPPVGRRNWTMNTLHVLYSMVFRQDQALPPINNGLTYDRVATYVFACARNDLA